MNRGSPFLINSCLAFCMLWLPQLSWAGERPAWEEHLKTSLAADFVTEEDHLWLRSAELMLYGAVDHRFDGRLTLAAHEYQGQYMFEVHEAFLSSSRWLPRGQIKVGHFFLNIGRLNQFHQHDWPFLSTPRVHREFLDFEAVADTGVEISYLLPGSQFLELTLGVTRGYNWGHTHTKGLRPQMPIHYLHPNFFVDLGRGQGLLLGTTYVGHVENSGLRRSLVGLDATYKWRQGRVLKYHLQSEIWYERINPQVTEARERVGAYFFPEYGLDEQWSAGLRLDLFSDLSRRFVTTGERQENLDVTFIPTLTFRHSEFALFRLAYAYDLRTAQGESDRRHQELQLQLTFILGDHPAHEF